LTLDGTFPFGENSSLSFPGGQERINILENAIQNERKKMCQTLKQCSWQKGLLAWVAIEMKVPLFSSI
jgi:hypothetical protein